MPLLLADGGISFLVMLAISAALSAAAYFLNRPKPGRSAKDQDIGMSTIATQGAYVPLLIGKRRVGPLVGWVAHPPHTGKARVGGGGGKGSSKAQKETIYFGEAWHLLCVGPAIALHRIWLDGKVIFDDVITPHDTPSGTRIHFNGHSGVIYWGEPNQPISEELAHPDKVGVASRWPHVCYFHMDTLAMGGSPRWGQVEYEIECGAPRVPTVQFYWPLNGDLLESIAGKHLVDNSTAPTFGPNPTFGFAAGRPFGTGQSASFNSGFSGGNHQNVWRGAAVVDAELAPGTGDFAWAVFFRRGAANPSFATNATSMITGGNNSAMHVMITEAIDQVSILGINFDLSEFFPINAWVHLVVRRASGALTIWRNGAVEHTATVGTSFAMDVPLRIGGNSSSGLSGNMADFAWWDIPLTDLEISQLASGAAHPLAIGTKSLPGEGVTFGGVVRQVLFDSFPHGVRHDEGDFNLDTITATDETLEDEGANDFSLIAEDGEEAGGAIGRLLQDAGVLWCRDFTRPAGKFSFVPVRQEDAPKVLPAHMLHDGEVEIEVLHIERAVDRLMFSFQHDDRQYRETVIAIDEDGQPTETGNVRGASVKLSTVVAFATAAVIAERRSQEELAGGGRFTIYAGRWSRKLVPGRSIKVAGIPYTLRVSEVSFDPLSSKTKIDAILDHYGAPASEYVAPAPPSLTGQGTPPEPNHQETFVEVPERLGESGKVFVAALRIRAHAQIQAQFVHFSDDDTTYVNQGQDQAVMAGGELTEALPADAPWEIEDGPTFEAQGPDLSDLVVDLTSNTSDWRRGRQVCLIGEELFFLRGVEALGGDSWRLKGLLRARYDTDRQAHAIGAAVLIFQAADMAPFNDPLLVPEQALYVKQQPIAGTLLDLSLVAATSKTLYGKGLRPPRVTGLSVQAPMLGVAAYETGDDVRLVWASRLAPAGTGAGEQGAGTVVAVGVLGLTTAFEIRVYDSGDDLVRTEWRSLAEWTYPNADLQDDLGGETDFRVEVREFRNGHFSAPVSLTVEAL